MPSPLLSKNERMCSSYMTASLYQSGSLPTVTLESRFATSEPPGAPTAQRSLCAKSTTYDRRLTNLCHLDERSSNWSVPRPFARTAGPDTAIRRKTLSSRAWPRPLPQREEVRRTNLRVELNPSPRALPRVANVVQQVDDLV